MRVVNSVPVNWEYPKARLTLSSGTKRNQQMLGR